jgi:methyl-accepting chemotaxis protein
MAKTSADSLFNSLKGKIWIATAALAFFICLFGLVSYLLVSFVNSGTFYAVFIPFIFVAFSVIVFGWWISGEVSAPVEKVSLLAKSLERGLSSSIPKTSGSTETDEILESLQRISAQVQKLVHSMDEAANGNLDAVFAPAIGSTDRVSQTFQKLLAKVAESINAKKDLDRLQRAIEQLSAEVAQIRLGNLDAEINSDSAATGEIAAAFKFLLENLNEIVARTKGVSADAAQSALDVKNNLQTVIQRDEIRVQELGEASASLKKLPAIVQKISEELSQSAQTAVQSIEKARNGNAVAVQNMNAVSLLRKQIQDAASRIERLSERSQEIGKIAKSVEDLAHRTNLVALNASIQAAELGEAGDGFVLISEEVERLAQRAENTNKQIALLSQTLRNEIKDVAGSLEASVGETANLSKFAIETGNALGELERYVAGFLNLQNKIVRYSREQSDETERAFQIFVGGIAETEQTTISLKNSESRLAELADTIKDLQKMTARFKSLQAKEETPEVAFSDFAPVFEDGATTELAGEK